MAIEGARVIISNTSKANFQGAFYGKGLIDVVVQEAGGTPNLNLVHSTQNVGTGLDMGSSKLGFKLGGSRLTLVNKKGPIEAHAKGIIVVR